MKAIQVSLVASAPSSASNSISFILKIDYPMKRMSFFLTMLILLCTFNPLFAQSSFPPKSYPSSIKVMTDAGVAQYWDVKRIMCLGQSNGGYKFRIYGKANADHRSQTVNMYYVLPGNKLKLAGAYQFPAIKEGQPFNFEIVSAFKGHAPSRFDGFMIMDEWLKVNGNLSTKTSQQNSKADIDVPEVPEEIMKTVSVTQIATVDGAKDDILSKYNKSKSKITVEDLDTDPAPKEEEIYAAVDVVPEFPGGMPALMTWLGANVRYPETAQINNVQGRVVVKFVVEKNGSIAQVEVVKGVDKDLDKEAVRVVSKMPKWSPGKKDGVPVRAYFNLPVTFRLTSK